ncbi:MAG: DUF732 domain-containing protein [Rhodococcus sp.]|nr:DUF732 domain-containing protein [Rhodococcus sp. (in: high G+C Gram-positive bacteria)]
MFRNVWTNNALPVRTHRRFGRRIQIVAAWGLCSIGLIVGCSSPTAIPESADKSYLREVYVAEVPFASEEVAINVGKGMCELIERAVSGGQTIADALTILQQQSDRAGVYSSAQNTVIIKAAAKSYCPEYGDTKVQVVESTPRATTATMTPEDTLSRMIKQFDQDALPYESVQWLQERANEVCADWDELGGDRGFEYAVLGQTLNFRPVDFGKAALAVTHLTQYGCPQWYKYIR